MKKTLRVVVAVLQNVWNTLIDFTHKLAVLLTFLAVVPLIIYVIYYFVYFNPLKIILGCISLVVSVWSNVYMKGERGSAYRK